MKNTFKKIFIVFILATIVFSLNFISRAEDLVTSSANAETQNEALVQNSVEDSSKNLFEFSTNDININSYVDGDVFVCTSGTVTINSTISGNVFVFATNVEIGKEATIESSLFNVSQSLNIFGTIKKNVYSASQKFILNENAYLGSDLFLTAENINFSGFLGRDAYFASETLEFSENSRISRDLYYSSSNECEIPNNVVSGEVKFSHSNDTAENTNKLSDWIMSTLTFVVLALIIFLISTKLAPKFVEKCLNLSQNIGKYILYGLLALVLTPIVSFILLTIEFTATVSIVLILAYIALIIISSSIFINSITLLTCEKLKDKIKLNDTAKQVLFIVLFAIVYKALRAIPVIGVILALVVNVIGAGILIKNVIPEKNASNDIKA